LPTPLAANGVQLIGRESTSEIDDAAREELLAAAERGEFINMIKTVGWHAAEITTVTSAGERVVALVEVQVISSSS
jgi:hypothetical protein